MRGWLCRALVAVGLLAGGEAVAWPYENYPEPRSLAGYTVATTAQLPEGRAELLTDSRITAANRAKVREILLGREVDDSVLQDSFDRDGPRWAMVRFTPKAGPVQVVVLDHALASIVAEDIQGDGRRKLRVEIDYLEGYRGRLTLFMEAKANRLEPLQYADASDGYRVQIELMDAAHAWWKAGKAGKATEFLMVDARFDQADLVRIYWEGGQWKRALKSVPAASVSPAGQFPARETFP
ncbi:MAG TPA: hypothetical protein VL974_00650 [Magnetospirillum sp.]|nr:hypothetical protein [Magnetospirillum sp.]